MLAQPSETVVWQLCSVHSMSKLLGNIEAGIGRHFPIKLHLTDTKQCTCISTLRISRTFACALLMLLVVLQKSPHEEQGQV